jgi:antitoxin ParD1/3/4
LLSEQSIKTEKQEAAQRQVWQNLLKFVKLGIINRGGTTPMATMNISLTPELVDFVNQKVTSGMYHTASEVVREGLRLLKEQDEVRKIRLDELRKEIAIGTAQLKSGESNTYVAGNELAAKITAEGRKRIANRPKANT